MVGGTGAAAGAAPTAVGQELVLDLEAEQRRGCRRLRYQRRHLRSAAAGVMAVTYRSGRTAAGCRRPRELAGVASPRMTFCYDTIAQVMRLRHGGLRQREEVRVELAARGIPISAGSVSNLPRLGLACLEQVHETAAARLGERYRQQAFGLRLDRTREGGQWCHFVLRAGFTGNVRLARKVRSEHSADIAAMLRWEAAAALRAGDARHSWLAALVDRIGEYRTELSAEGFPFDLPNLHYARRCASVLAQTEAILAPVRICPDEPLHRHLMQFRALPRQATDSGNLARGATRLARINEIFQHLRDTLHPRSTDRKLVGSPTFFAIVGDARVKELGEHPRLLPTATPLTRHGEKGILRPS